MNLQRLVSYFDIWGRSQHGAGPLLAFDNHGAFGRLGPLWLDSHYQPLFDRQQRAVAYEALLRVSDPQRRRRRNRPDSGGGGLPRRPCQP